MTEKIELLRALKLHTYGWGRIDPNGTLLASWGNQPDENAGNLSLEFRDFFWPHSVRKNSIWAGFPERGLCSLKNHRKIHLPASNTPNDFLSKEAQDLMPRSSWEIFCGRIDEEIRSGRLQKVVPSRAKFLSLGKASNDAFMEMFFSNLLSPPLDHSHRFFLKWGDSYFFGSTPELLFHRKDASLFVPAIAGTKPMFHSNATEPGQQESQFLADPKERSEHQFVVQNICEKLTGLGLEVSYPKEPSILRLKGLMHLYTPIEAKNASKIPAESLVEALHPTAAVGGYPQEMAKQFLYKEEPWSRGLFASPLLFREGGEEICLVAIRSGLFTEGGLYFFAGAGYVSGSDADREWNETEMKTKYLQNILAGAHE